jgi:hypothetical protein
MRSFSTPFDEGPVMNLADFAGIADLLAAQLAE